MRVRILVTGGAGFVGSHLTARLAERGDEVFVLDDLSRGREEWLPEGAHLQRVDLRDRDGVLAAVREAAPDKIVHLAALHFIPAVDGAPALARAINVDGTRHVADAVVASAPARVVFASTAAVYPDSPTAISETVALAPIDLYGETKVAGEQLLAAAAAAVGASCALARLFNVIGPHETNPHVVPEVISQVAAGAESVALGAVHTVRDFVDVRDVADALVRLLDLPQAGIAPFNVGTGHGTSIAELVALCGEAAGRTVAIEHDAERMRPVDRAHLIADPSALAAATGWLPAHTVAGTVSELLRESQVA